MVSNFLTSINPLEILNFITFVSQEVLVNFSLSFIAIPLLISDIDVSSKTSLNFYIHPSWAVVGGDVLIMDDRKITGNPINQPVY